ncbi:MAG TPA: MarR family transcriptional regulator [Terracidiphilus sp.]|jgi:DNA-binding MarR family transcriptional regulator|nr:MarR family transcriptional regulator [Terracidiphilus sp.]
MVNLKTEIAQQRPFTSPQEEALLNIMRTADCLHREFHRRSREFGVTSTQYNVLRILRGSNPDGLTCGEIGDRMITADPDITRLLKRLSTMGLIRQKRDTTDRRVVRTFISPKGLELLEQMDPVVAQTPVELLSSVTPSELEQLIVLLEKARAGCADGSSQPTCDGSDSVSCDGSHVAATGSQG